MVAGLALADLFGSAADLAVVVAEVAAAEGGGAAACSVWFGVAAADAVELVVVFGVAGFEMHGDSV